MHPTDQREFAVWIAGRLREHGHIAYLAGGCVRDRLLGLEPADYDVATDARPDRIKELFRSAIGVGESFGVVLVRRGDLVTEVATFRSDGVYTDGRHPDSVDFGDEREDAARRDFTINAIFEDPLDGRLIDHFSGRVDLEARVLRAVGDPDQRLDEDRLRVLRAIRFAARFDLEIEPGTSEAITRHASLLGSVSRERIGMELRKMLADPGRARAVELLQEFRIDVQVLGDRRSVGGTSRLIEQLPREMLDPIDALAAWLLDRGDACTPGAIEQVTGNLLLSNNESKQLAGTLLVHRRSLDEWDRLGIAGRKRLASDPRFTSAQFLLGFHDPRRADSIARDLAVLERTGLAPEPLLDGETLITAGLTPGPAFRRILDEVYDAQLEQGLHTSEEALERALQIARRIESEESR
ncbi:MAG: CCA tRNA nucleotidyltransferase [Planctomycetota bacterium]|nr:CCA tRNA nucleotidyltransferase [Planctomycetota bacterium]